MAKKSSYSHRRLLGVYIITLTVIGTFIWFYWRFPHICINYYDATNFDIFIYLRVKIMLYFVSGLLCSWCVWGSGIAFMDDTVKYECFFQFLWRGINGGRRRENCKRWRCYCWFGCNPWRFVYGWFLEGAFTFNLATVLSSSIKSMYLIIYQWATCLCHTVMLFLNFCNILFL